MLLLEFIYCLSYTAVFHVMALERHHLTPPWLTHQAGGTALVLIQGFYFERRNVNDENMVQQQEPEVPSQMNQRVYAGSTICAVS